MRKFLFYKWKFKLVLSAVITALVDFIILNYINGQRAVSSCLACEVPLNYNSILKICGCGVNLPGLVWEILLLSVIPFAVIYIILGLIIRRRR